MGADRERTRSEGRLIRHNHACGNGEAAVATHADYAGRRANDSRSSPPINATAEQFGPRRLREPYPSELGRHRPGGIGERSQPLGEKNACTGLPGWFTREPDHRRPLNLAARLPMRLRDCCWLSWLWRMNNKDCPAVWPIALTADAIFSLQLAHS